MSERLNFIKDISKEDFMRLDNIDVLSKYWQRAQTKDNLNVRGDFLFLKSHSCLASINNNFLLLRIFLEVISILLEIPEMWLFHGQNFQTTVSINQ